MSVSHQKKAANGRLFYSILISRFFLIGLSLGALGVLGERNKTMPAGALVSSGCNGTVVAPSKEFF